MKKIKLFLIILILSLSALSCKTVPTVPPIVFPTEVATPVLMMYDSSGKLIQIDSAELLVEKDFYIIQNPSTKEDYRHNFIVMMSYSTRLQDYIDLLKEQNK